MTLLFMESNDKKMSIAQMIFDRQFQQDQKINEEYDDYRKRTMLRDILYNLEFLEVSMKYRADLIFQDYADWIVKLLANRMKDLPDERVRQQMITHYQVMKEVLSNEISQEQQDLLCYHLDNAIRVTKEANLKNLQFDSQFKEGTFGKLRAEYLSYLLEGDKHGAKKVIDNAINDNVSLLTIYTEIFQPALKRIGDLWHSGSITIDKEHYCTAVTQSIMGQLYPLIFSKPRVDRTVVASCIGNELHEMGVRMLCDILEIYGWDSVYLGAAVPKDNIINAIIEHQPDMVVLSVTMPTYLETCKDTLKEIKEDDRFSNIKVAVGGRAFQLAPHLPNEWNADITGSNGVELAEWAKKEFGLAST